MGFIERFAIVDDDLRKNINVKDDLMDVLFLKRQCAEDWKDIEEFGLEKLDWLRQ